MAASAATHLPQDLPLLFNDSPGADITYVRICDTTIAETLVADQLPLELPLLFSDVPVYQSISIVLADSEASIILADSAAFAITMEMKPLVPEPCA